MATEVKKQDKLPMLTIVQLKKAAQLKVIELGMVSTETVQHRVDRNYHKAVFALCNELLEIRLASLKKGGLLENEELNQLLDKIEANLK